MSIFRVSERSRLSEEPVTGVRSRDRLPVRSEESNNGRVYTGSPVVCTAPTGVPGVYTGTYNGVQGGIYQGVHQGGI